MKRLAKIQIAMLCFIYILSGCSANGNNPNESANIPSPAPTIIDNDIVIQDSPIPIEKQIENEESKSLQMDLSDYFQGINGSMVIYSDYAKEYYIYNADLSEKRSSPYSTFKIVSALIGMNENILESDDTIIAWNGINYPIDEWNGDLTLEQAFQLSCVWYFRNVIDRAGEETVNKTLAELSYGNCDTSQWGGSNTNQNYDDLNGFWLESSLLISPKEQVDVLIQIFSEESKIDKKISSTIKNIMKIDNADNSSLVYGKTGTGLLESWFVGITECLDDTYYFALRLNAVENGVASGQKAKEIALNIINGYLWSA